MIGKYLNPNQYAHPLLCRICVRFGWIKDDLQHPQLQSCDTLGWEFDNEKFFTVVERCPKGGLPWRQRLSMKGEGYRGNIGDIVFQERSRMCNEAIKNLPQLVTFFWNRILYICRFVWILFQSDLYLYLVMHISIVDDIKKRFHAACAIRGLKMSQVVTELVEQWLKTNEAPPFK